MRYVENIREYWMTTNFSSFILLWSPYQCVVTLIANVLNSRIAPPKGVSPLRLERVRFHNRSINHQLVASLGSSRAKGRHTPSLPSWLVFSHLGDQSDPLQRCQIKLRGSPRLACSHALSAGENAAEWERDACRIVRFRAIDRSACGRDWLSSYFYDLFLIICYHRNRHKFAKPRLLFTFIDFYWLIRFFSKSFPSRKRFSAGRHHSVRSDVQPGQHGVVQLRLATFSTAVEAAGITSWHFSVRKLRSFLTSSYSTMNKEKALTFVSALFKIR